MMMCNPTYGQYTVTLKALLEDEETKEAIYKALSSYPLYEKKSKEEYIPSYVPTREELNKKILNAYKYREIGFDTVGRFIDELEIAMNEIMPKYNQLFYTIDLDYNLLYNADYKRTITATKKGTSSSTAKTTEDVDTTLTNSGTTETTANDSSSTSANVTTNNKDVQSNTPQGQLDIGTKGVNSLKYADSAKWNAGENTENGTTSGNSHSKADSSSTGSNKTKGSTDVNASGTNNEEESSVEELKGNYGMVTFQLLVEKYRDLIINVEQQLINDHRINELFMQLW